jgi:hypothetical protein
MGDPTLRTIDGETGVLAWRAGRYRGRVGRHLRVYTMMQRVRADWLSSYMERISAFDQFFCMTLD